MLNAVCGADDVKAHWSGIGRVPVAWLFTELDAIVRQNCVDLVWHCLQHHLQELPSRLAVCFVYQLRHGKLAGSVNGYKEKEFAFVGAQFGDIDMEIPDPLSWFALQTTAGQRGSV